MDIEKQFGMFAEKRVFHFTGLLIKKFIEIMSFIFEMSYLKSIAYYQYFTIFFGKHFDKEMI